MLSYRGTFVGKTCLTPFRRHCTKSKVLGIVVLFVLLLCTLLVNDDEIENPALEMSAAVHLYPLPIKNLRRLIQLTSEGGHQLGSKMTLNPELEFSPLSPPQYHCRENEDIGLLILIKSAVGNNLKRANIRAMWANENYLNNSKIPIKYAFFLGVGQFYGSPKPAELLEEIQLKRDLVLVEYIETYRNNTFKTMAMLKWAHDYCPNHEFVITMDDDVYLSMTNLIKFLQQRPQNYPEGELDDEPAHNSKYRLAISPNEFLYAGAIFGGTLSFPERSIFSKSRVSWRDYPFRIFPNYATGAVVIYTRKTYRYIYLAAPFVKFLDIDDVYIGIVAAKLGILPTALTPYIACCLNWAKRETAIGIHGNSEELLQYWNQPHNSASILKSLTSN